MAFGQTAEYVYVETNLSPANSIRAFERAANGQLREIAGSPFVTGGSGSGYSGVGLGPDDSDQEIATNADQSMLFAINAGSDSISVFRIGDNGSLAPVKGSPFPSGGNDPVSLDIAGNLLFVANKSGDPNRPTAILPNYTTLVIGSGGSLSVASDKTNDTSRRFDSTISVATGGSPEQVHAIPGTNLVFGNDFLANLLEHFQSDWIGGLHQLAPLALPASLFSDTTTPRIPQGIWNHPTSPYLYVGVPLVNKLAVYSFDRLGNLTFIRAVPNQGSAICWLRTNRSGTRLYSTETFSNSVGVYDITDPENPTQLQDFNSPESAMRFNSASLQTDATFTSFLLAPLLPSLPGKVMYCIRSRSAMMVS
jgi:DNA-binding beta-propeller fold protein YncE